MDGRAGRGGERTLRRIIVLLASLAVLAERAAERSLPVRWLVLWILRRAETVVEGLVFDETGMLAVEAFAVAGNGPGDAYALATRFRALAAALASLLPDASPLDRWLAPRGGPSGCLAGGFDRHPCRWAPKPYDTS